MHPSSEVVGWSDAAQREVRARARGRSLVIDYFASRCCGSNVSIGDLSVRWQRFGEEVESEFARIDGPGGLSVWIARDIVPVLGRAGARVVMRGPGWFRHLAIELDDGSMWLDFVASCRYRSPLRH